MSPNPSRATPVASAPPPRPPATLDGLIKDLNQLVDAQRAELNAFSAVIDRMRLEDMVILLRQQQDARRIKYTELARLLGYED